MLALVPTAQAATKPTALLAAQHTKIQSPTRPVFRYSTAGLPAHHRLFLQRQFGPKHVWKAVAWPTKPRGTVSAPGLRLGRYVYRLRVASGGHTIAVSRSVVVYSHATVTFAHLCEVYAGTPCYGGTVEVGNRLFAYDVMLPVNTGTTYPVFSWAIRWNTDTSCRWITVHFTPDVYGQADGDTAFVRVMQTSSDPVNAHVSAGAVGTLFARLDGGPFHIDVASDVGDSVVSTGTASCWTRNGKP